MIGMQYKIILPTDYDMEIIRRRVHENGHKTDGFPGLLFKAYLTTETGKNGGLNNSYAPLYIWNTAEGMNSFVFDGYYDNILASFGWQHINIGVPLSVSLEEEFVKSSYAVEYAGSIPEQKSLTDVTFTRADQYVNNAEQKLGDFLIYNPDKWGYSHFSFYKNKPEITPVSGITLYEILHISGGDRPPAL
ncbi:hypothetical protein QE429_000511 [Bacillus sp. SORGH_AS 510]|uniref:DUF4865 family protein n=1 Tax=Bacillus sp. SORGH_AS_0510 TaxID=3041771 RepID=UPI00278042D8|nr:DUF4865 family protein [Bacillus sp. SORGH_AS_0510]MDQ1143684.1 hypothetical protein [Bacillus sp. SORGH_AS_0510]